MKILTTTFLFNVKWDAHTINAYNMKIKNKEQYLEITERVKKAEVMLEGKWQDPKYKRWVEKYNILAMAILHYEMDNNLLPL